MVFWRSGPSGEERREIVAVGDACGGRAPTPTPRGTRGGARTHGVRGAGKQQQRRQEGAHGAACAPWAPRRPPARVHHPFRAQRSQSPLGPWSAPAPRGAMAPPGTSPPRTRWPRATLPGRLIRTRRGVQSSAHRGWLGARAEVGGGRGRGKARPQRLPRARPAPPPHPHGRKEPSPKPGSAPPPLRGVRHLFEPLFSSGTTRLIIPTYLPVKEGWASAL